MRLAPLRDVLRTALIALALTALASCSGGSDKKVTPPSGGTSFDSGPLAHNQSFSFTFPSAGATGYHCSIHSSMTGTVNVAMGQADSVVVQILGISAGFSPQVASIRPGGVVRWVNADNQNHTATSN